MLNSFCFVQNIKVSFFESVIRTVGGLLGAYTLCKDKKLVEKAKEIADILILAYERNNIFSAPRINLKTKLTYEYDEGPFYQRVLAEIGSVQMEFCYLSYLTGDPKYAKVSLKALDYLYNLNPGLYPVRYDVSVRGVINPTGKVTIGALADSFYEYNLKLWLFFDKKYDRFKRVYEKTFDMIQRHLVVEDESKEFVYLKEINPQDHVMDHLACFMSGAFALSAHTNGEVSIYNNDLRTAKRLADACVHAYRTTVTGLAPEIVSYKERGYSSVVTRSDWWLGYYLRPETIESLYVLYAVTQDAVYKDIAWEIFVAINATARVDNGFSSLRNVQAFPPGHDEYYLDKQESFFLAETLKYLYLIFSDDIVFPFDKFVFTTEAHIFPVLKNFEIPESWDFKAS